MRAGRQPRLGRVTSFDERRLVGLESLAAVTELLQRIRIAHPTAALFEAADLQWWWRVPRSTDVVPQLFWFDDAGRPDAAVILTDFGKHVSFDPIVMPAASPDRVARVVTAGLAHAAANGFDALQLEVARPDETMRSALLEHGFSVVEEGLFEAWIDVADRPMITPVPAGYRTSSRAESAERPHHMISARRNIGDPEARLRQTSLYRPDLDLVVYDDQDTMAAYGLFWFDPTSATGLVEPMRTEDEHQQRGLARHVLTRGVDLLAQAGARRVKICFEPGNAASSHLYVDVGFRPDRQTDVFAGRAPSNT